MDMINPLHLVKDASVSVKFANVGEAAAACIVIEKNKYEILINEKRVAAMFKKSWVAQYGRKNFSNLDQKDFMIGLLYHEVSHILYKSFDKALPFENGVIHFIWNVLLDAQCEYSLTKEYPFATKYIRLALSILKLDTVFKVSTDETKEIQNKLSQLFYLVRFGVILPGSNENFINFCLPLFLSAMRGTNVQVIESTLAIYEYIVFEVSRETEDNITQSKDGRVPLTRNDIEKSQGGSELSSSIGQGLNDLQKAFSKVTNAGSGGVNKEEIEIEENESPFYRDTINKHIEIIKKLRQAFKLRLNEYKVTNTAEGDMNFTKQQDLYVSSFTEEGGLNFLSRRKLDIRYDVVIVRDISGSTCYNQDVYAELTVVLLAAIHKMNGVRVAEIDFSGEAFMNLDFDQPLNESRIHPRSENSTYLDSAYTIIKGMKFKAKNRLVIVITDGGLSDFAESEKSEIEMKQKLGIQFSKWNVNGSSGRGVIGTTFRTFHVDISRWLMGKMS